jgi:Uma2 family endonuclease
MATERYPDLPPIPEDYEPPRPVTYDEYVRLAEGLPGKYEYHAGLMYPRFYPPGSHWAMAGGTVAHDDLIVNVITTLRVHLGTGGQCRVHTSDMKLKARNNDYFPDAYVACGEARPRQTWLEEAVLICEVRSQSTAEFDRGDKFEAYKHLPSLREYLVLDNRRPQLTLFQKSANGTWTYLVFSAGTSILLTTIDRAVSVDELYDGVRLDPDPTSGRQVT